ncbi:uncharacterized protein LOC107013596 [Solanum pennellii]|uniref:Uncharacterized protein LOC107013596 n=1 Tax=Solanum pennellii TaxID=28526 RepID=A0ABM1GC01_SOLPN|nr:uncharacterized protein LOC107013596 [Solanum pennellii]
MASLSSHHFYPKKFTSRVYTSKSSFSHFIVSCKEQQQDENNKQVGRREIILRSSEIALIGALFNFSGKKPNYLGVQKNPLGLALCPATNNCVSTSENISDATHYAPPWNYNPEGKRGKVSREKAMEELLQVLKSTKPDKSSPRIMEKKDDYVRVEYESPILGLVDDVEFWFPPGKTSIVQYRAASRMGNYDFDANRKRIKALRLQLEKKGWASEDTV